MSHQSIQDKVISRIYGKGRGWVFTPKRFLDLGPRKSVDMALSRLTSAGTIRRLGRGLYDYPKKHPKLGLLSPNPNAIAKALIERDEIRLQPSGAYAMNLLGLSQQVPAHIVYLTDATTRTVQVGKQKIHLLRSTPRMMATAGTTSGLVIQALRYMGKDKVSNEDLAVLRNTLSDVDKQRLKRDHVHAPTWMHPHLFAISQE
jgi:predicted transcriptional regulator of viral defense system